MFVCCECCVLSGRCLCDEMITRPEESYRLWCVAVCDLRNLKNEEAMTRVGSQRHRKKKIRHLLSRTPTNSHLHFLVIIKFSVSHPSTCCCSAPNKRFLAMTMQPHTVLKHCCKPFTGNVWIFSRTAYVAEAALGRSHIVQ